MNKYLKEFLLRGLIFSGFGPLIAGIVFLILNQNIKDFSLNGFEIFLAILSTYVIAFIHAGTSVFHQIEHWSPLKSASCQLILLYIVYLGGYLINLWLPLEFKVVLIFSLIFIGVYFAIWLSIYLINKNTSNKLNKKIN